MRTPKAGVLICMHDKKKLSDLIINIQTHERAANLEPDGSDARLSELARLRDAAAAIVALLEPREPGDPEDDWPEL